MDVMINNDYKVSDLAVVKELKGSSVVLIVRDQEIAIEVDQKTLVDIQEIMNQVEDTYLPIDLDNKMILLDAKVV